MKKLAEVELDSDEAEVVFENIPQEYRKLKFYLEDKHIGDDEGGVGRLSFNDGDGTVETYRLTHDDSISTDINTDGRMFNVESPTGRDVSATRIEIEGYSNSKFKTTMRALFTRPVTNSGEIFQGWWDRTESVESITFSIGFGDEFAEGSYFALYGVL